jgi:hypothetical protein
MYSLVAFLSPLRGNPPFGPVGQRTFKAKPYRSRILSLIFPFPIPSFYCSGAVAAVRKNFTKSGQLGPVMKFDRTCSGIVLGVAHFTLYRR